MSILDPRTVLISYVISNAICALAMLSLWRQRHRHAPELGFWLADFVMQFLAVLLIVLRGRVPDFFSIVIASALVMAGTLVLYIGLERYVGKPSRQRYNYALLAVFIAVHAYFTYARPSILARNLNFSIALLVICSQCAWLMLRRVDAEMRPSTMPVGWAFVAYSVVSAARIPVDLAVPPATDLMKSGLYDTLVILTYEMLFIALTFTLLLMRNHRLIEVLERDIVERAEVEHQLRALSIHDSLTGLYNRLFFEEEVERLERGRQFPISILIADLDDLKTINDHNGHAAGDVALRRAARVLTTAFRGDIIARIGGDEFVVLLPKTDAAASAETLRRVQQVLKDHNREHPGMALGVSFGMGTAVNGESLEAALHRADASMYRKKRRVHRTWLAQEH
jgi:diguanylate cyclase (GGDEF)-like protein